MDYQTLVRRAIGVPDVVSERHRNALALTLLGNQQLEWDEFLEETHGLVTSLALMVETGELDHLFVGLDKPTVETLARRLATASFPKQDQRAWPKAEPESWLQMCTVAIEKVVQHVRSHPYSGEELEALRRPPSE